MLKVALDKVCEIVVKARVLGAKVDVVVSDYGSNPADEDMREILEDFPDDATFDELSQFIDAFNEDEQIHLVALTWVGRDDFSADEWDAAVSEARNAHDDHEATSTAEYLMGIPLLAEYLEDGLSKLGLSCESYEPGDT